MMGKDTYTPRGKNAEILDRAWDLAQSVPYKVTGRWIFYRLLQEGYYTCKDDYRNKWMHTISGARHANYKGWRPDSLEDDKRSPVIRGSGFDTPHDWLVGVSEKITCNLTYWNTQSYYLELWIEAQAMAGQFCYYTKHITVRPMSGQPSIPYKYEAAKGLERAANRYGIPIVILYFGDLDEGGLQIEKTTREDVGKWCDADFEFIRCGLNRGDPERFNIPENPEKPDQYQWEALPDDAARELIVGNVTKFVSLGAFSAIETQEQHAQEWLRGEVAAILDEYPGGTE